MFLNQCEHQEWLVARDWLAKAAHEDKQKVGVLTITSSLTDFLHKRFGMDLTVQLHEQWLDHVSAEEAVLLRCDESDKALRRSVSLRYQNQVMYDAESVLPLRGLPAALMSDLEAGKRPLANLLMAHGLSLARSDLSVGKLLIDGCDIQARRSVLRSALGAEALVVELFYPEFWLQLQHLAGAR